jgi:ribosomal protein S18 acetylase RimI-like enzyme
LQSLERHGYGLVPVTELDSGLLVEFSCGKPHLDDFLRDKARFFHADRLGLCWVVLHKDFPTLVGYFTLNNDSLELTTSEEGDLGLQDHSGLKRFPAICIGRLAVDRRLQGMGVGAEVMRLAIGLIADSSAPSAARIVVVDADNDPKVLRYYERHGFLRSAWAEKQAVHQGGKQQRPTIKMLRDIVADFPT